MYEIRLNNGFEVYNMESGKMMHHKPFSSRSKAKRFMTSLYSDTADENDYHKKPYRAPRFRGTLKKWWLVIKRGE